MDQVLRERRLTRSNIKKIIAILQAELIKDDCSTVELEQEMIGLNELTKELKSQDRVVLDLLFDAPGTTDAQLDQESSKAEDIQKLII